MLDKETDQKMINDKLWRTFQRSSRGISHGMPRGILWELHQKDLEQCLGEHFGEQFPKLSKGFKRLMKSQLRACYENNKSVGRTFDLGVAEKDFRLVIQEESYEIASDL